MLTIIYGNPGMGKSCLLAHFARETAFNSDRNRLMRRAIQEKNQNGFQLAVPKHCVSANFTVKLKKPWFSERFNRYVNPFRLGFANNEVKTHYNFPYEAIYIDEAQKYYDSKKDLPAWQSLWFEQHRHLHLDITMATQRPMRINKNIRDISQFIEIRSLKIEEKNGHVKSVTWKVRRISSNAEFEEYMATGKTNRALYVTETIKAEYNVFDLYDSYGFEPEFYRGNLNRNLDISIAEKIKPTWTGYFEHFEKFKDDVPELEKTG